MPQRSRLWDDAIFAHLRDDGRRRPVAHVRLRLESLGWRALFDLPQRAGYSRQLQALPTQRRPQQAARVRWLSSQDKVAVSMTLPKETPMIERGPLLLERG